MVSDKPRRHPKYEYWQDNGAALEPGGPAPWAASSSSREVEAALRACAQYHQHIIR